MESLISKPGLLIQMAFVCLLWGCEAGPRLTPEQRAAIETRELNASREKAFRAVVGAMLDEGYRISMSSCESGLVRGVRVVYPGAKGELIRASPDGSTLIDGERVVQVSLTEAGCGKTVLRAQFFSTAQPGTVAPQPVIDEELVRGLVDRTNKRLLASAGKEAM